ncbi:MAG: leucine-rich repeat domain-containing protein [Fibrobacterota bacterium]
MIINCTILLLSLLFYTCSVDIAGATSETTNGTVAMLPESEGVQRPAANADIYIRSLEDESTETVKQNTNSNGIVEFEDIILPSGKYLCEFVHGDTLFGMLNLEVTQWGATVFEDSLTLTLPGHLRGSTELPEGTEMIVSIAGLKKKDTLSSHQDTVYSSGSYFFENLPEGTVHLAYSLIHSTTDTLISTYRDSTYIASGDTTILSDFIPLETDLERVDNFLAANNKSFDKERILYFADTANGRITGLSLNSMGIHRLTSDLFDLPLMRLSLARNYISEIPPGISRLSDLVYLDLSRNTIRELPDEMAQLNNCETLNLGMNMISAIPLSFVQPSALQSLQYIHLDHNYLRELQTNQSINYWMLEHSHQYWAVHQYSRYHLPQE